MRFFTSIFVCFMSCTLQAGQLYNPIETRKQIISYYREVGKAWMKNDWQWWRFKEVLDPLRGASEFLEAHIDQLSDNRYSKDRIERYIKRIKRLRRKIFRWLETLDLTLNSFSDESDSAEQGDNRVLTPSYQNLSDDEFYYTNEENNWDWMDVESQ